MRLGNGVFPYTNLEKHTDYVIELNKVIGNCTSITGLSMLKPPGPVSMMIGSGLS